MIRKKIGIKLDIKTKCQEIKLENKINSIKDSKKYMLELK